MDPWRTLAAPPSAAVAAPAIPLSPPDREQALARSCTFAWCVIAGLPAFGILASLAAGLPLFVALMAMCFLLATASVCRKPLATFTGRTLRLLVAARFVVVTAASGLLFCASGAAWSAFVSAVVLWLPADRLLGRRALYDLWKFVRAPK